MRSKPMILAALLLTFGSLSDRFGRKGMLLAGLAVAGTASLAGGFTTTPVQLIAARSVMGLGAAMTLPATLSLISNVFTERRERARAIGLWGAISGVAIAMGPIVGSWLLEHFSWVSIFIAMAPVAAAAALGVALAVPASKDPEAAAPDIPRLVLSSATMALLVFTIIEEPTYGWGAARSVAGFAASAVLLAAFIATMPASVPGRVAAIAHQSVGAAYAAAGKIAALGHPDLGQALQHASTNAFLRGLTIGSLVAGTVAAAGALLAVLFLPAQPAQLARPVSATAGEAGRVEGAREPAIQAAPA